MQLKILSSKNTYEEFKIYIVFIDNHWLHLTEMNSLRNSS
jgi:hypothetical protein